MSGSVEKQAGPIPCDDCSLVIYLQAAFFFQALQKEVSNRLGYNDVGGEEAKKHIFFRNINWPQLEAGMFKPPFVPDVSSLIGVVWLIESLSSDIFEWCASTRSERSCLLLCLDATKFVWLSVLGYFYKDDLAKNLFKIMAEECKKSTSSVSCYSGRTLFNLNYVTCIYQVFILSPGWIFFFPLIIWDGPLHNYLHQIVWKGVFQHYWSQKSHFTTLLKCTMVVFN